MLEFTAASRINVKYSPEISCRFRFFRTGIDWDKDPFAFMFTCEL